MPPAGAVVLLCVAGLAVPATAQEVAYSGSLHVASGTYLFDTRTNSVYLLSGIDLTSGRVRLAASIPLIAQSTPWIAHGPVPVPTGGRQAGEVDRQTRQGRRRIELALPVSEMHTGVGDPLLHGQVRLVRENGRRPSIGIGASAKVPIAGADDGLGTGAWDYGAGVSLSKAFGTHLFAADLAFWRFGDPEDLPLDDAWSYAVSYGRPMVADRWSLLVWASGFTSVIEGHAPPTQVGVAIGRLFSPRRVLTGNVAIGVTNTAPDVTVGIGWRLVL